MNFIEFTSRFPYSGSKEETAFTDVGVFCTLYENNEITKTSSFVPKKAEFTREDAGQSQSRQRHVCLYEP